MSVRILLLLTLLLVSPSFGQEPGGEIPWFDDYDAAVEKARAGGSLMVVYFWEKKCAPCEQMGQVWSDPDVAAVADRVVWVRVNAGKNTPLKELFWVGHPPNLVLTDSFGTKIGHLKGARQKEEIAALLGQLPADVSELHGVMASLEENEDDPEAAIRVGEILRSYGWYEASINALERAARLKSVKQNPKWSDDAHTLLAFNYMNLGNAVQVENELRACLKRYPESEHRPQQLLGMIWAGLQQDERVEVQEYLAELQTRFPDLPETERAEAIVAAYDED